MVAIRTVGSGADHFPTVSMHPPSQGLVDQTHSHVRRKAHILPARMGWEDAEWGLDCGSQPDGAARVLGRDDPRHALRGCPCSRASQTSGRWAPVNHWGLAASVGTQL